jgi:predicted SnoaL-like aldol condensation-catalyzing enzyme
MKLIATVAMTAVAAFAASAASSQVLLSAEGQQALLRSQDPQLAANKKLVYDMYREIVQGGHAELAEKYFTKEYIQHNPNVGSGRDALVAFLRGSRPAREIKPTITLPFITIVAERDIVIVISERREKDSDGKPYVTTWFDMYRIENGKIAEHWDPALKTSAMAKFDPNVGTSLYENKDKK